MGQIVNNFQILRIQIPNMKRNFGSFAKNIIELEAESHIARKRFFNFVEDVGLLPLLWFTMRYFV